MESHVLPERALLHFNHESCFECDGSRRGKRESQPGAPCKWKDEPSDRLSKLLRLCVFAISVGFKIVKIGRVCVSVWSVR